jgi:hypothetical protein
VIINTIVSTKPSAVYKYYYKNSSESSVSNTHMRSQSQNISAPQLDVNSFNKTMDNNPIDDENEGLNDFHIFPYNPLYIHLSEANLILII